MKKNLEESYLKSCRGGRTAQTRLIRNSQMPKDFFRPQQSTAKLPKHRCSEISEHGVPRQEKQIFE